MGTPPVKCSCPGAPQTMKIGGGGRAAAEAQAFYGADEPDVKLAWRTRQAPENVALSESRSTQRKVFRIRGSPPTGHQLPGR